MSVSSSVVAFDEAKVDAIFHELDRGHLPGVAVGVALKGRPLYRKGFGLANQELPVVLSPSMRMRIGSVTKQFAALAYLLLCEEGRAGIDDPIGKYFPEFHSITHQVTARQLMGHTSGLRDVTDLKFRFAGLEAPAVSSADLLTLYRTLDDVDAAPGNSWMYNNGGYLILSAIIERITGQPLEAVLKERIFAPVGMHDTVLRRSDTDFLPRSATPHTLVRAGVFEKRYWGVDFSGAGAMVSTVDDLLRWLAHMDAPTVGNRKTWTMMKAPMKLANGSFTGYGLGLIIGSYRGADTIHHGGGWIGGNAQVLKVPPVGLDVVVIANRSDVFAPVFVNRILDACLPDLDPVEDTFSGPANSDAFSVLRIPRSASVPASVEQFATGAFRSPATGHVVQLFEKDGRQIVSIDGHDLPYLRATDGTLRPVPIWSFIKRSVTIVGAPTRPESLLLTDFGTRDELFPLPPVAGVKPGAIAGRYRSATTATEAQIRVQEGQAHLETTGRWGSMTYVLECLGESIWRLNSDQSIFLDAVLCFDAEATSFRLSSYVTRSLPFDRVS